MSKWMLHTKKADFNELSKKYNISPVTARIMINRGVKEGDFDTFLNADMEKLSDYHMFKDIDKAVSICSEKVAEKKKIRVIGDYDIDGVCATYILTENIRELGGDVSMDIPDRMKDGYGINIAIIERAIKDGVDTIITCDNGIAAIDEIQYAKDMGLTVIVTDHHEVPIDEQGNYKRVNADAVVNHKQPDCSYPYKQLCGASVALIFMKALCESFGKKIDYQKYLPIAGIATIGDVVDLTGENRIIAKLGLKMLSNTENFGLNALMDVCSIDREYIVAYHVGFVLGPCLNASGRLETAKKAYKLLVSKTYDEAFLIAKELKELNDIRKDMTDEAVTKAKEIAETKKDRNVLVLYVENVHESIAGIVAGRVREAYYKPVIILTKSEEDGVAKGSGRSIEGYDMFRELSKCASLFKKFGGHPMAAGLSLPIENIEKLEDMLNENETMSEDELTEKMWIDVKLPFYYNTKDFIRELSVLEPFGKANEKPVFAERPVEVLSFNIMGKNRNVAKMTLKDAQNMSITALYFCDAEKFERELIEKYGEEQFRYVKTGRNNNIRLSVSYYPQINSFRGEETVQIVIKEIVMI